MEYINLTLIIIGYSLLFIANRHWSWRSRQQEKEIEDFNENFKRLEYGHNRLCDSFDHLKKTHEAQLCKLHSRIVNIESAMARSAIQFELNVDDEPLTQSEIETKMLLTRGKRGIQSSHSMTKNEIAACQAAMDAFENEKRNPSARKENGY